ncbi:MAG: hypothetical protein JNM00_02560 [Flavobacteriales bacterium]|nr:hypothetical protein [Flavobacteriales bacterium]
MKINVLQNGEILTGESITLDRAPFELVFESRPYVGDAHQWYAVQVAATTNKKNLKYLRQGPIDENNPFFGPGTGLAADGGYPELFIGNSGCHYITWEEHGERRAEMIERLSDGRISLSWKIANLWFDDQAHAIENPGIEQFYLMIWFDENLNNVCDDGESEELKIVFR